jgi:hypothetical protein
MINFGKIQKKGFKLWEIKLNIVFGINFLRIFWGALNE